MQAKQAILSVAESRATTAPRPRRGARSTGCKPTPIRARGRRAKSSSSSTYSYNSNDQLLQEAVTGGSGSRQTAYQYDANGSLTNQVKVGGSVPEATTYTYDLENRLSGATIYRLEGTNTVAITASYLYNPSGIRVRSDTQTQINGSPGSPSTKHTFYLVDSMNHTGYAQVLEESSSTGSGTSALDRSYTIGDDVLAQSDGSVSPATHYLGYDGHGSTRILTDSTGAISSGGRYNYDAYGVSLGAQPSTVSPPLTSLLYTSEQFDTGLQQYYLRARYYNQATGRFNSLDTFAGGNFDPQSLHKYAYAHGDPVNGWDPSGHEFNYITSLTSLSMIYYLLSLSIVSTVMGQSGGWTTTPVGEPGFGEGLIPIWGSGRAAIDDLQTGRYGWFVVHASLAITDVFLVRCIVVGIVKGGSKLLCMAGSKLLSINLTKQGLKNLVKHHIFPQADEFRPFFERVLQDTGATVHDIIIKIPKDLHEWIHAGSGLPGGGIWNNRWRQFIQTHPDATLDETFEFAARLMIEYGLYPYTPIIRYFD